MPGFDRTFTWFTALLLVSPACESKSPASDPTAELPPAPVFGDQPRVPPQFAGLEFGMTRAEAQAAMPSINEFGRLPLSTVPGYSLTVQFSRGTDVIERFSVSSRDSELSEQLNERWGEARARTKDDLRRLRWFNPSAGIRASVGPTDWRTVEFTRYRPTTEFLGPGPKLAFQADNPLLGMSLVELTAAYGEQRRGSGPTPQVVVFTPLEWDDDSYHVRLAWADGKIGAILLDLDYGDDPADKAATLVFMTEKWGPPTEEDVAGERAWVFADARVRVRDDPDSRCWRVTKSQATP